ncbi:LacI family DNA-binding transcriptional regulator [Rubrivivax gelatinosus]|uniref:LacI family transcriptional regulator n=1 Tax=Rubrivivax gelatinosus TaxID=28068 RepID=A0A4R2MKI0_RUBGE|nr:LacI family DNA-binding transcriptional regulator [Rubrivivax gelatinosus]MBK1690193.1 LacI family transcriptional regulator [Rubrivivax gelatinosus]TCP03466.1 LacI family transcriptional regulator [Rubrivivax gelatinosus]
MTSKSSPSTIRTVAERAGVSVATVSHVLNGTRHVSDALRARVEAAMRDLDFVPSAIARSLKQRQTHTIGMMTPNSSNPYFAEIVQYVEDHGFGAGYHVVLCNSNDDPRRQSAYLQVLAERRIDGLVLVPTGDDATVLAQLDGLRMPVVLLDRPLAGMRFDAVCNDNRAGARLAVQHLVGLGHRRIGCIGDSPATAVSCEREAGWREVLAEAGLADQAPEVQYGHFTAQGGFDAMQRLLQQPQPPTAVFACNDAMAIGALGALAQAGLAAPADVSIVGYDDVDLAHWVHPALTTVAQPKQQMSRLAVDLLIERIERRRHEAQTRALAPSLVVRASSAAPRVAAAAPAL